jgi:hypothetical protein
MHRGNQSNFVASNIKRREFPNLVGVRKGLAQLREIQKPAFSHNGVPTCKRRFGVRVLFRELVQALSRNDMHYGGATLTETFSDEKAEERMKEELGTRRRKIRRKMPACFLFCLAHPAVWFDNFCIVRRQLRASVVRKTNIITEERNYGITRFNTRCS